jgi:hypothetical protein
MPVHLGWCPCMLRAGVTSQCGWRHLQFRGHVTNADLQFTEINLANEFTGVEWVTLRLGRGHQVSPQLSFPQFDQRS